MGYGDVGEFSYFLYSIWRIWVSPCINIQCSLDYSHRVAHSYFLTLHQQSKPKISFDWVQVKAIFYYTPPSWSWSASRLECGTRFFALTWTSFSLNKSHVCFTCTQQMMQKVEKPESLVKQKTCEYFIFHTWLLCSRSLLFLFCCIPAITRQLASCHIKILLFIQIIKNSVGAVSKNNESCSYSSNGNAAATHNKTPSYKSSRKIMPFAYIMWVRYDMTVRHGLFRFYSGTSFSCVRLLFLVQGSGLSTTKATEETVVPCSTTSTACLQNTPVACKLRISR